MTKTNTLRYLKTDNGNCRVYYAGDLGGRYCFQEDRPGEFTLYVCSRDGEPSHEIKLANVVIKPPANEDSATNRSFREWRQRQ